jgi:hypothetical protein
MNNQMSDTGSGEPLVCIQIKLDENKKKFKLFNCLPIAGDHPMNIPTNFGSNWPSGFRQEY